MGDWKHFITKEIIKYLIVGGVTAIFYIFSIYFFVDFLDIDNLMGVSISYFSAVFLHFVMNKFYTFKNNNKFSIKELLKYMSVTFFNYLITLAIVHILVNSFGYSALFGALVAIAVTVGFGYFMSKSWIFIRIGEEID